jgi:hypothetical protein
MYAHGAGVPILAGSWGLEQMRDYAPCDVVVADIEEARRERVLRTPDI